jgi:hypothetical protein
VVDVSVPERRDHVERLALQRLRGVRRNGVARLSSRNTQQTWLMILRSLLRYLADDVSAIPTQYRRHVRRIRFSIERLFLESTKGLLEAIDGGYCRRTSDDSHQARMG